MERDIVGKGKSGDAGRTDGRPNSNGSTRASAPNGFECFVTKANAELEAHGGVRGNKSMIMRRGAVSVLECGWCALRDDGTLRGEQRGEKGIRNGKILYGSQVV